jgi:hypothetical protein
MHPKVLRWAIPILGLFLQAELLPAVGKEQISKEPLKPLSSTVGSLTFRHIEGGGVGYNKGYTTVAGLMVFNYDSPRCIYPLLDLRFHEFNNNRQAANVGLGLRGTTSKGKKIFGGNIFYDYRNTGHANYNQAGLGFELLGQRVDLRMNGYITGRKHVHRCLFTYPGGFFISREKREVALSGANLEVGFRLVRYRDGFIYAAAGPYYYTGKVCHSPFGGQGRLKVAFVKYLFLEGIVSHDNVFHTRVQGMVGLTFPLGNRKSTAPSPCTPARKLASQPIQRNEIIVIEKECRWDQNF